MKDRLLGALLVVIYAVAMLIAPKPVYILLVYLLGLAMSAELFKLSRVEDSLLPLLAFFSVLYFTGVAVPPATPLMVPVVFLFLFGYFAFVSGELPPNFLAIAGFLSYMLVGVVSIGRLPKAMFLLLLSVVWSTDTISYLSGRFFGRKPLLPAVSPKKTVEGALGGALGGMLTATAVLKLSGTFHPSPFALSFLFMLVVACQVGDLLESYLKRSFGVKDSGALIPGHGGVLDRLDSSLAVAPFLATFGGLL
jgi:phosphatidate cytidylyltransferase